MNRKPTSEPTSVPPNPGQSDRAGAQGPASAAIDALKAPQLMVEFVGQAQALQFALVRSWAAAMQSALEAAARAQSPGDIFAVQSDLVNAVAAEAMRCQAELTKGWQALQEELAPGLLAPLAAITPAPAPAAGAAASMFAMPDLASAFEQAQKGIDAATREWTGIWARLQAPMGPSGR